MFESKFQEKNIVEKPACPFCTTPVEKPAEERSSTMPMGSCTCGAVFVCDVTGHNLGSAMVEGLLHACKGDSDKAWNLLPEEDYLERQVKHYDLETHSIIHSGAYQGRRIGGVLLFIRLQESDGENPRSKPGPTSVDSPRESRDMQEERARANLSKKDVEALVNSYDVEPLVAAAENDKRVLRSLKRLLYSPDDLQRLRAAEFIGRASRAIGRREPEAVSRLLQELFSSVTDTAASSWGAVDAIGEIIRCQPDLFSSSIRRLALLSQDPSLAADVLRALVRIGGARPDLLHVNAGALIRLLENPAPLLKGYAAMLVGLLKMGEARERLEALRENRSEIPVYDRGTIQKRTIAGIAQEALGRL
ncbi:MAG: PBS lyase [Desulfobacteraceae bacterium]|nr:MAG: PBS lyase [Desulfobacteraceae bacterium]